MGCDGGTIPKRDELVRTKQKQQRLDRSVELAAKWQYCAISSTRLHEPIVSCPLGRLYNKQAVIEYLLDKSSAPNSAVCEHIRSMKDIRQLGLTSKTGYSDKKSEVDGQYVDTQDSEFVCPVVGIEMNGNYKFCYIATCGCVMSDRALKEVKSDNCHKCNKEFSADNDIIVINGTDEEVEQLRKRMIDLRDKEKSMKKSRKRKATAIAAAEAAAVADETVIENGDKPETITTKVSASIVFVQSSTSGTTTTTRPQPSAAAAASTSSATTSTSSKLVDKSSKLYSVANDPKASETYKSLFTSHETARKQPKAHWVTFNPCYY
ncbi:replication termination factor 2-like [Oppia nitens]|uniref:replication termination factor 2-like n=1 Tax=Oppia nitens TaxID=1686743 RepID=UPI0023DA62D5|nr:replication termination factor 2-like [Oppia nitens]